MSNLCTEFYNLVKNYHNYIETNQKLREALSKQLNTIMSEDKKCVTLNNGFHNLLNSTNTLTASAKYCVMGSGVHQYGISQSTKSESEFFYGGHYRFLGSLIKNDVPKHPDLSTHLTFCQEKYKSNDKQLKRAVQEALSLYKAVYGEPALQQAMVANTKVFNDEFKSKYKDYLPKYLVESNDYPQSKTISLLDTDNKVDDDIQWQNDQYSVQEALSKTEFATQDESISSNNNTAFSNHKPQDLDDIDSIEFQKNQKESEFFLNEGKEQSVDLDQYSTNESLYDDNKNTILSSSSMVEEESNDDNLDNYSSLLKSPSNYKRDTLSFGYSNSVLYNESFQTAVFLSKDDFEQYAIEVQGLIEDYNKIKNAVDNNIAEVNDGLEDKNKDYYATKLYADANHLKGSQAKNFKDWQNYIEQISNTLNNYRDQKQSLVNEFNELSISELLKKYRKLLDNQVNNSNDRENISSKLSKQWDHIKNAVNQLQEINTKLDGLNQAVIVLNHFDDQLSIFKSQYKSNNTEHLNYITKLEEDRTRDSENQQKLAQLELIKKKLALLSERLNEQDKLYQEDLTELDSLDPFSDHSNDYLNANSSLIGNYSIVENDDQKKYMAKAMQRRRDSILALGNTIKALVNELAVIQESIDNIDQDNDDKYSLANVENITKSVDDIAMKINDLDSHDYSDVRRSTQDRASFISLNSDINFNRSIITINQTNQIKPNNQPQENKMPLFQDNNYNDDIKEKAQYRMLKATLTDNSTSLLSNNDNITDGNNQVALNQYLFAEAYAIYKAHITDNEVNDGNKKQKLATRIRNSGAIIKLQELLVNEYKKTYPKNDYNNELIDTATKQVALETMSIFITDKDCQNQLKEKYKEQLKQEKQKNLDDDYKAKLNELNNPILDEDNNLDFLNNLDNDPQNEDHNDSNDNKLKNSLDKVKNDLLAFDKNKKLKQEQKNDLKTKLLNQLNELDKVDDKDEDKEYKIGENDKQETLNAFYEQCIQLANKVMNYNYALVQNIASQSPTDKAIDVTHDKKGVEVMHNDLNDLLAMKDEMIQLGVLDQSDSLLVHLDEMGKGILAYQEACNLKHSELTESNLSKMMVGEKTLNNVSMESLSNNSFAYNTKLNLNNLETYSANTENELDLKN